MRNQIIKKTAAIILFTATAFAPFTAFAQTQIPVSKNKYKVEQDVKLGNDAAREVEKQFPILRDAEATRYVERVGQKLVAAIPQQYQQPAFNYSFQIVNASDINAFALPGGPMFVNRGMIQAAKNEGEMAGVMAHEISHVALRHATAQATKQQSGAGILAQLPIIAGAIFGGQAGAELGSIGTAYFMTKYSRAYETQADTLGAQIMARAGYDPRDLANMFQTIQNQEKSGGGVPEWLSSHPDPGNRYQNINREAGLLQVASNPPRRTPDFIRTQSRFNSMAPAKTMAEIEKGIKTGTSTPNPTSAGTYKTTIEAPSARTRAYNGVATVNVPTNWKEFAGQNAVQFAPEGAYGSDGITRGAMIGIYQGSSGNLATDTKTYVDEIMAENAYLRKRTGYTQANVGGQRGLTITLAGKSPVTGKSETVTIYTVQSGDGNVLYLATVAPDDEAYRYSSSFRAMVGSFRFTN